MQAAIKLLNEFPVLSRPPGGKIQSSIMLIQRDLKGFQTGLDELRAEVRRNTEYRLRQEGPVK